MRHSNMIPYVTGCIALLIVGTAVAKDPSQTLGASASAATPAGCVDSPRGRTHVLRFCGDKHYWIKTATTALPFGPTSATAGMSYVPALGNGPAQNWGCCQRY